MFRLGKWQELQIVKTVEFGVYLGEAGAEEERVLLPGRQVPEGCGEGDVLRVFLYKDSKDRLIATVREPLITLGEVAVLKVKQVTKLGAFLDWGLEKDLFLPFKEQTKKVSLNEEWPVALYIDKSERLCATMKIYHYLLAGSSYKKDDMVNGIVYETSGNFGAFVAVDNKYSALIPKKELYGSIQAGDRVTTRVAEVKEDGRLSLSLREKAYKQIGIDAVIVLEEMEKRGGELPFTDKASPELIREEMRMSKNEFKRAVGNLLKEGKIEILKNSIRKVK